ncbi:hypothetical protein IW492_02805 [Enterococcus sp. BWB1-3]|uniref:hypothetical protein n=1 Tax=Enterococcus sp. BWB1-3 TaxID=2787713 RepID=UPI0019237D85|nr:hypothetical protein [Enterococcus sp. BWB1-3]MBL1228161.1 hypothetical protein [Enterococcus sp. BWB1-3]
MTEQKEKLKSVRDNLEELLRAPHSDMYDPDEIIENCVSILDEVLGNQQTFKVWEYYITPDQRIYKIRGYSQDRELYTVDCFDQKKKVFGTAHVWHKDYFGKDRQATAEEIGLFKRAEHFHSKNRKYSEFKNGDIVQNKKTGKIGYAQHVDEDGDVVVVYKSDKVLNTSNYKCTGALYLVLIMTAEELEAAQEVRE